MLINEYTELNLLLGTKYEKNTELSENIAELEYQSLSVQCSSYS